MNLGTIWDIIHAVTGKESRGNTIKPDEFSSLLQQCHIEYFNQQYEKAGLSQTAQDSLRPFRIHDETVSLTDGSANLSALEVVANNGEYAHCIAMRASDDGSLVDIVSDQIWHEWAGDAVMQGSATDPLACITGSDIKVLPIVLNEVKMSYYVRLTLDTSPLDTDDTDKWYLPFFDYYTDANDEIQYLSNGVSHELAANETYRDGTDSGTVTGASHELKWNDEDKVNIVSLLLQKIGVAMQSPDIAQYAMALQQQQNVV